MGDQPLSLADIGRYLRISSERARQIANVDPSFPSPLTEQPRRWSRQQVEGWAETRWWGTWPTRTRRE
jgi:hypothetical protein